MTDGPTGIQVAPITEDDMSRVQSILSRAANAIVAMSQLSADVDMLRSTVAGLQADAERLRSQNNALDEALLHSRQVRSEQTETISTLTRERDDAKHEAAEVLVRHDKLMLENDQLTIDLDLTRKAKDDAEFKALELEDALQAAKAKLVKVEESFISIFGMNKPAFPTLPVSEVQTGSATGQSQDVGVTSQSEPAAPPAEPEPAPIRRYLDAWEPGAIWDGERHAYYIDHA